MDCLCVLHDFNACVVETCVHDFNACVVETCVVIRELDVVGPVLTGSYIEDRNWYYAVNFL